MRKPGAKIGYQSSKQIRQESRTEDHMKEYGV